MVRMLHRAVAGLLFALATGPCWTQTPTLHQPSSGQMVVVPAPAGSNTALDFDWSDLPSATTYELEVKREGGSSSTAVCDRSHTVFSPLETGTLQSPTEYSWSVTAYENGVPGTPSDRSSFTLASGGLVSFEEVPGGLSAPEGLSTGSDILTFPYVQGTGVWMQWLPVEGALEYEVQLVLDENLRGEKIGQLHYRMNVTQPQALVTNSPGPARYRFDIRGIGSGGEKGNPSSGSFDVVESLFDMNRDGFVNGIDLLDLGTGWQVTAASEGENLHGDLIHDGIVDQGDVLGLIIRLKRSTQSLPDPRPTRKSANSTKTLFPSAEERGSLEKKGHADVPQRTGWVHLLGDLLLGTPALAGEVPKDVSPEIEVPRILFPTYKQCVAPTPFEVIWTEVPGATSYAVEIILRLSGGGTQYQNVINEATREGNFSIVIDDNIGNGVVKGAVHLTFPNGFHTIRVQARVGEDQGSFTGKTPFVVSTNCKQIPDYPFIDLDFNRNRRFDGADVLVFATKWMSATGEAEYDPRFDLYPGVKRGFEYPDPDGIVNVHDLLRYKKMFGERYLRPKSPRLSPPLPTAPPLGEPYLEPELSSFDIPFSWIASPTTEYSIPSVYEMEVLIPPNESSPTKFFSVDTERTIQFLNGGEFWWHIRAIADDGTFGHWSLDWNFSVDTPTTGVASPELIAPAPNSVRVGGASVVFAWTREEAVLPNVTRFDRLEIHNGSIFSVSFDVYHHASEIDEPTVVFQVPLFPNFGTNFRWRVVPYEEFTDSKPELFQFRGFPSKETRRFQLLRDPEEDPILISSLGSWQADRGADGEYGLRETGPLGRTWYSGRDSSRTYDVNYDFDYNGFVTVGELFEVFDTRNGVRQLLHNGIPAPVQITPTSPIGATPEIITFSSPGTNVIWYTVGGAEKYLIEWIDHQNHYHAHYAQNLDPVELVSPLSGQVFVVSSTADQIPLIWEANADAQEYDVRLENPGSAALYAQIVPQSPHDATVTYPLTAGDLIKKATPDSQDQAYTLNVYPKACGRYTSSVAPTTFRVQFLFPIQQKWSISKQTPSNQNLNLPLLLNETGRLYARQPGLHHWRVTPVAADLSLGIPTKWETFGIVHLGPGYGHGGDQ